VSGIPDEAVEAVTEAIEPYVALGKYVPDAARAALSAALPAIERAHLERLTAVTVHEFPRKAALTGPQAQWDAVKDSKMSDVLNAVLLKVGPVTVNADDILAARRRNKSTATFVRAENAWRIDPGSTKEGDKP
jgi:hypothetical protein